MATISQYTPKMVSHPGQTLGYKIQELGMSVKEFAIRASKPEKTIIAVIKGDSSITPDMAVAFENVTKIPAHFWMARQRKYDEAVAREKMEAKISESIEWAEMFPLAQMIKYGWIEKVKEKSEKVKSLLQFFALSSADAWHNYYMGQQLKVAFRISLKSTQEPYAISAWLRQGDKQAEAIDLAVDFSEKSLREKLSEMKQLMATQPKDWHIALQDICASCGIKLVYTQSLPKAPINGATRWIAGKYPVIQMSGRQKRYDIFWFSFFHEIGHILLHGKKDIFLENIEYDDKVLAKEKEADDFASRLVLSIEEEIEIIEKKAYSPREIKSFAKKFGTHHSIIVGRLQHNKMIPFNCDSQLLDKIELFEN